MTDDVPRSRPLIALLVIAAAPVTVMLTYVVVRGTLPDRIPDGPSLFASLSSPRRPLSLAVGAAVMAFVAVVVVGLMYLRGYRRDEGSTWLHYAAIVVWVWPACTVGTLVASIGAPTYEAAAERWWALPLGLVLGSLALTYVGRILNPPLVSHSGQPVPESSLRLADRELAVWTGSARSKTGFVLGLTLLASAIMFMVVWPPAALVAVLGLGIVRRSTLRVRIDSNGVHPRSRWLSHGGSNIPLLVIASAAVTTHLTAWQDYNRMDWEKKDPDVTQYRVRAGPALSLTLHSGKRHSISLDHADEAADVVNALVARHRRLADDAPAAADLGTGRR